MKSRMIFEYLKTIIFAVMTSVFVSFFVCYFLFFAGKAVDNEKPQYLILGMKQYIQLSEGEIKIEEAGLEALKKYQTWIQILDKEGKAVYSKFVPEEIPMQYSYFEFVNDVIESNRIEGYTLFVNELAGEEGYSILIGCDSEIVSKYSVCIEGGGNNLFLRCILVFLLTSVCMILFAAYFFAKKVTIPITNVIQEIDDISKGQYDGGEKKDNLFHDVFLQLSYLQAALEENENLRAIWISNISHDVKTPLSTIKGYAELLNTEEYEFGKAEIMTYAGEILKSESIIEGLVEDLKISQMLAEGKMPLKKESIRISKLLEECAEDCKSSMKQEDSIEIFCEEACRITADRNLIKRSLSNIICNAFVHNEKPVKVTVSVEQKEECLAMTISDNGKGLEQGELKYIFERYYRGTSSGVTKGTGLGLAIAKEAVLAHDGTIKAENNIHGGVRFVITFKVDLRLA